MEEMRGGAEVVPPLRRLNLLHVCVLDLLRLDAEVIKSLLLATVVEHGHKGRYVRLEHGTVDVSESLSQRMGTIVPLQVDLLAPCLDHVVQGGDGKGRATLPRLKQRGVVLGFWHGSKKGLNSIMDGLVNGDRPFLPGLLLFVPEKLFSRLQVPDLPHGDLEQVGCPEIGVDAGHE